MAAAAPIEPPAKTESPPEEKRPVVVPVIPNKSAAPDVPAPAPETKPPEPVARTPQPALPVPVPARPGAPATDAAAGRDQTALAERSPATPNATPNRISKDELSTFLRRFASIYEAGDLDQFVALFADNARTNDRVGRKGIRDDYEALFRATDVRQMKLGEISWELEGNQAYGWGDFDVNVRRVSDRDRYVYTGSMTFVIEKTDGRLRIVRLYHGQRRAEG